MLEVVCGKGEKLIVDVSQFLPDLIEGLFHADEVTPSERHDTSSVAKNCLPHAKKGEPWKELPAVSRTLFRAALLIFIITVVTLGFAVGLLAENAATKRIFTPILGLALPHGIFTYLRAEPASQPETASV